MSTFKVSLGFLVLLIAATIAFAFSPRRLAPSSKNDTFVWIKYDCQTNPQVKTFTTSDNFQMSTGALSLTGNFSECTDVSSNICAYRFLPTEVHSFDSHNKVPNAGVSLTGRNFVRCQ